MSENQLTALQERRIRKALAKVPYAKFLGIEVNELGIGMATLSVRVRKEFKQNHGVVHGGAIASLIDSATAFAILTVLEPNEHVTTVDLTINYLRPVTRGRLVATAKVIRSGRRIISVNADAMDGAQTLVATALSTYIRI